MVKQLQTPLSANSFLAHCLLPPRCRPPSSRTCSTNTFKTFCSFRTWQTRSAPRLILATALPQLLSLRKTLNSHRRMQMLPRLPATTLATRESPVRVETRNRQYAKESSCSGGISTFPVILRGQSHGRRGLIVIWA